MNPADVPLVGSISRVGTRDRVFDVFLLLGPVIVASIAVVGRNPLTTALAACYVLAFVGHVGYRSRR